MKCAVYFGCLALVVVAAESTSYYQLRDKPRSIRGFKNGPLSTARGFGKRTPPAPQNEANAFTDTLPADWLIKELQSNEDLARYVVRSLLDSNQDGLLTPAELLRPPIPRYQDNNY